MPNTPSLPVVAEVQLECAPAPIPTQIACGMALINGKNMVVLQVANASGVNLSFLPPEMAREVAKSLETSARMADTGLVVAQEVPGFAQGSHGLRGSDVNFSIGRANGHANKKS